MTEVSGRLALGSSVEAADFADLTDVPVESVGFGDDGRVCVVFAGDLEPDVEASVRRRIVSRSPAEEAVRAEVAQVGEHTSAWTPTTDVDALMAQVDALTKQVQGLTSLLLDADMEGAPNGLR